MAAVLAYVAPGAGAAKVESVASIVCPAAPPDWTASPQNPAFYGPAQQPGQNDEKVTCAYSNGSRLVSVAAEFALPIDPNPFNDFDYGCSTQDQAWNATDRIYLVMSRTQWGYAELVDTNDQLRDSEVSEFESVTRELLKNSEGAAHGCALNTTKPQSSRGLFVFSFEWSALGKNFTEFGGVSSEIKGNKYVPAGAFTTASSAKGSSLLAKVVSVRAPSISLTVIEGGKEHVVVIRINKGIDYRLDAPLEQLRLRVLVIHSNYSSCKKGAQGTLTITTHQFATLETSPASVRFSLCGSLFSRGSQKVSANIVSG